MAIRFFAVDGQLEQRHRPIREYVGVQPRRRLWLVILVGLLPLFLMILILTFMITARTGTLPMLPDLPQSYLPGSPQPQNVSCTTFSGEYIPRCSVSYLENEIYFNFGSDNRTITRTLIPARAYMLGQLILAWGAPSGITWNDYTIYLYWGKRSALVYARSLQPDSPVEFILYDLVQQPASPWRGFWLHKY
jgi:hypothetical protein